MRAISWTAGWVAVAAASTALGGCGGTETTRGFPSPDCRASYKQFATAPTFGALKAKLLRVPRVDTMRRVGADADHTKLSVSLLDRKSVVLMALELRRVDDGRWIAEVMTQGCQ